MEEYSNLKEGFIELDGEEYYAKFIGDELNQIIGNELAYYCDINCVTDKVVRSDDDYFYLSYSLHNLGIYESGSSLGLTSLNLYEIWLKLEEIYPKDVEKLMRQLIRIFVFDSLLMYGDRHLDNFGILSKNKKVNLYILDNEYMFCDISVGRLNPYMIGSVNYSKSDEDFLEKEIFKENYQRFATLISSTSNEFYEDIKDIYYKLTPEVVKDKLFEMMDRYPDLIRVETIIDRINMYEENYKIITKILEERGLINGKRIP